MSTMTSPPDSTPSQEERTALAWLHGLRPPDGVRIGPEILAGITLAAIAIPQVMGYTKIVGMPVVTGLYTLLLPALAFAFFGSSRHLAVCADSATAAMVAAGLASLSVATYSPHYVALASLVALISAGILFAARILRLGFLADFLSRTVLVGFFTGVGVQVALAQLAGMIGLEKSGNGPIAQLASTLARLPQANLPSLYIALAVLTVIVGFGKFVPRFPGALLAMIGATAACTWFHWTSLGVRVAGAIRGGLPHLGLPDVHWSDAEVVLPISISCFIVILAQSAATSRSYALRYQEPFNENVDLVGLALANAAAGCSGTFVVNGSPTNTASVDAAGGRSQWSHVAAAVVVLLVLLFLTKPLGLLPNPVLAAIVFLIGLKLVDLHGLMEIRRQRPNEYYVALVTAATVIFVGVEEGILLAMVLSLAQHVRRSYRPHTAVILHDAVDHWRMEDAVPGKMMEPGLVMFWFGSDLFYANVNFFAEEVMKLVRESPTPVRWFVVDGSAITGIDFTAARAMADLHRELTKAGVVLALARVQTDRARPLSRFGLVDLVGADRIFDSRIACLMAYRAEVESGKTPPPQPSPSPTG